MINRDGRKLVARIRRILDTRTPTQLTQQVNPHSNTGKLTTPTTQPELAKLQVNDRGTDQAALRRRNRHRYVTGSAVQGTSHSCTAAVAGQNLAVRAERHR
jgi:hypothetical protein